MTGFIRTMTASLILGGLVLLGYWWFSFDQQARTIRELEAMKAGLEASLAARDAMIERLGRSRRIAHLFVESQRTDERGRAIDTDVTFVELDDQGAELARQQFTVPGDVLFVDAWTIKFNHRGVAEGDPLMGRTLVLLRRIYSDRLAPKDGLPIDTPGAIPPGYAATDAGRFEKKLWENFWALASDARLADELGVRVAQGEAVYKPVRAGQRFELLADAAGGLSLTPMPKGNQQRPQESLSRASE